LWQAEFSYGLKNHSGFNEAPVSLLMSLVILPHRKESNFFVVGAWLTGLRQNPAYGTR
jgi:hypothetical protein